METLDDVTEMNKLNIRKIINLRWFHFNIGVKSVGKCNYPEYFTVYFLMEDCWLSCVIAVHQKLLPFYTNLQL